MRKILQCAYWLLAFLSPFGSADLFNLRNAVGKSNEQNSILPIIFGLCILFSIVDKNIRMNAQYVKQFIMPLGGFFLIITLSGLLNDYSDFGIAYYIKLFAAESGFLLLSMGFITYPKLLKESLMIYAYTSTGIAIAFFSGLLDGGYHFSNGRLWIFGINPNTFSFMMGFAVLIFLYQIPNIIETKYKLLNSFFIILLLFLILLTGSRGTLIFIIISLMIMHSKYLFKKFYIFLFIGTLCIFTITFWVSNYTEEIAIFERFSTMQGTDSREDLIEKTYHIFEESPIIGIGAMGYKDEMMRRYKEERDAHNIIFACLAMSGIIGTTFLFLFLYKLFRSSTSKSYNKDISLSIFIYMLLISMKTGNVLTYSLMWYIFAIAFSYNILGRKYCIKEIKTRKYSQIAHYQSY